MEYEQLIRKCALRHITLEPIPTIDQARHRVMELIEDGQSVSTGGSTTLNRWGIVDDLRQRNITFFDRFVPGLAGPDLITLFRQALTADVYVSSVNALTEDGDLMVIDKVGNRAAALMFGPKKVIVVVGKNKLVKDTVSGRERIKTVACPQNARRLGITTPCSTLEYCTDCSHPQRMCYDEIIIRGQSDPARMTVLLVDEDGGF
jgi:hypothetical protein